MAATIACLVVSVSSVAAAPTVDDMINSYGTIFPSNNRNAASHRWATWIFDRSATTTAAEFATLFSGFCPVSGSPVSPTDYNAYHYTLPLVQGGGRTASGIMHHCCAPCVCDTLDMIAVDTKTVALSGGIRQQFNFAVIGDPCAHPEALTRTYTDAFQGSDTTLAAQAPELQCVDGRLRGATLSDHGAIIIGMLGPAPALTTPAPTDPTPGRVVTVGASTFQDAREFSSFCAERAQSGYNSGMGLIFRLAAAVSPLGASALHAEAAAAAASSAVTTTTTASACAALLPAARIADLEAMIRSEPILLLGMRHMRCTVAASERLEQAGACFRWEAWDAANDALYRYLQCLHPDEYVNG